MDMDKILKGLDKIGDTLDDVKLTQREQHERLLSLEQMRGAPPAEGNGMTLGAEVARQFARHSESFARHKTLALDIERKSITASLVGARASVSPSPGPDAIVSTALLPKLRMDTAAGAAAMIYPRRAVAITGGAAAVGENVSRPQSEPIYTSITQALCTVAGHAELSETALRTTNELQRVVDLHLQADVLRAADVLLVAGGTNFTGGLLALATADVLPNTTPDLLEQFIAIEAMRMRSLGYQPDVAIVNPTAWEAVYLRREAAGLYVHGSPLLTEPLRISGCAVVFSSDVATGQSVVIDSRYIDFMPLDRIRIELAYVASQFLTGEITMRAELQGIPVVRDLAAIKLVSRAPT